MCDSRNKICGGEGVGGQDSIDLNLCHRRMLLCQHIETVSIGNWFHARLSATISILFFIVDLFIKYLSYRI